jgi:hypothetical protein
MFRARTYTYIQGQWEKSNQPSFFSSPYG